MSDDVEVRPVEADELETFEEYVQYGFWPEQGSDPTDWNEGNVPRELVEESGERWGAFVDGTPRTVGVDLGYRATFRGSWFDVSALSSGVTPPEFRRMGHSVKLATGVLQRLRDRGVDLASGFESTAGFWRQIGLAISGNVTGWECHPSVLKSVVDDRAGTVRRVDADDVDLFHPIHMEHVGRYDHTIDRTETWWDSLVLGGSSGSRPHAAVWERDGEPRGYVIYEMRSGGSLISVRDMGYADHEAYRQLLAFVGRHDVYVDQVVMRGPENTELFDLVDDPADLDCTVIPGPSLRVVDVQRVLSGLSYPDHVEGTVALSVSDRAVDANDGTFRLAISDGSADCEPTDADPDVSTDVATLAQLVAGYRPLRSLERAYDLTVHDEAAGDTLAAAFPERVTHLYERF